MNPIKYIENLERIRINGYKISSVYNHKNLKEIEKCNETPAGIERELFYNIHSDMIKIITKINDLL